MSMDLYRFGLYCGFTGMVSMAALSFLGHLGHAGHSHGGDHSGGLHHGGHAHGGHDGGAGHAGHHSAHHTPASHHGDSGHAHSQHHHAHQEHGGGFRLGDWLTMFLSPRVWFSVLLGFGATGVIFHALLPEPFRFFFAVCGGIGFEKFMVAPLWNFWFRFAGESHTLESAVAEEARAVTNFDASGHGLVALNLDGQVVQLLAKLSQRALSEGAKVRTGDTLLVEDVDSQRQRCTVSPLRPL